jgi:N-acetylmuramoyl-L-alanine amidase
MATRGSALAVLVCVAVAVTAQAQPADQAALFKEASTREATLRRELSTARPATATATRQRVRTLVGSFEDLARLFPLSGQADKALWQGASLSADLFFRFGDELDRDRALRLLSSLAKAFPGSSYARQAPPLEHRLQEARAVVRPAPPLPLPPPATSARISTAPATTTTAARTSDVPPAPASSAPRRAAAPPSPQPPREPALVTLRSVRREVLPEASRVTIELDREVPYYSERIPGPDRVFVDLPRTRAVSELKSAVIAFQDDVVRRLRVGAQLGPATRVVLDLEGGGRHSVYTLYNPYRIVIDVERGRSGAARAPAPLAVKRPVARPAIVPVATPPGSPALPTPAESPVSAPLSASAPVPAPVISPVLAASVRPDTLGPVSSTTGATADFVAAAPSSPVPAPAATPPPATPSVNARGGFSLSRQLGLGIARIVIDAGHGGHDPGARVKGLSEAELTLDIALRLEKLLLRQPGVEVVLTRRSNAYVALEERTEIANRSDADLFLSIHANASEDRRARGVETYFLSLAETADAEATAARENAGSTRQMRQLPELLRAITLNDKIDESRDLARMVQQSLYTQARKSDKRARNLGVKQAPFVVLVGAAMPSILTEISFLTNQQDAGLLATEKYRQQLAEALLTGITRYQQSLKRAPAVATQ